MTKHIWAALVKALLFITPVIAHSSSFSIIGDNTNNYTTTLGNIIIQQPNFTGGPGGSRGFITFTNATYTLAEMGPSFSQIGGGNSPDRPSAFVNNTLVFHIQDTTSSASYDAVLTFWQPPQGGNVGGLGVRPEPFNNAGFVMQITPVISDDPMISSVKVPATPLGFLMVATPLLLFLGIKKLKNT
ncbi:MAG: hypothetical protein AAGB35_04470 [Pseudomonadota bacterium]